MDAHESVPGQSGDRYGRQLRTWCSRSAAVAREGASVVIAARRRDQSQEVVRQVEAAGGAGHFIQSDVGKSAGRY
jgi:hypothetical protein